MRLAQHVYKTAMAICIG